jgi:hypothetical protein
MTPCYRCGRGSCICSDRERTPVRKETTKEMLAREARGGSRLARAMCAVLGVRWRCS